MTERQRFEMATVGHNIKRVGAEVLAEMLAGYGVTHVFMVPAVLRRTFAEMERRTKIARVHCHGEKSAAYMADGYARASGKPGICMAQVIGALNIAAGLRDAWLAHSPVIAFTGGRDPKTKFRRVYQEIDDVPAFEPVTKFNATVDEVARIPDMVRQAFRVATSGAPGPVHLQFRGNEGQIDVEEAEMDALVETQFAQVPPFRPQPEAAPVKAALDLLQKAERPIFVAGGGVRASGAGRELVALAEALQIPIATSLNGKDTIPGVHPLSIGVVGSYSRESANRAVNRADLVCFIGTESGGMTTHFWAVPKIGTPAIQIDIEPESIGRNYPLQASVLGDAKAVLSAMLRQADKASAKEREAWARLPFDEKEYTEKEMGARELVGEPGIGVLERTWARPTLEVHGIRGGFTGEGAKTVIPARAVAKVSTRLVANQTVEESVKQTQAAVKAVTPKGVTAELKLLHAGEPSLTDPDNKFIHAAADALKETFGQDTVYIRSGGSIPIVGVFDRYLGIPSVMMGFGLPDDNLHAPNEKFHLPNFYRGIEAVARYLEVLGAQ
jgi:hypothetical protein